MIDPTLGVPVLDFASDEWRGVGRLWGSGVREGGVL